MLKKYLKELYLISIKEPIDLANFRTSLYNLFEFLTSPQERRAENVLTAAGFVEDHFLDIDLPRKYEEVLNAIMGLHGAFDEPKYHTQPEEVMEMIKQLPDN